MMYQKVNCFKEQIAKKFLELGLTWPLDPGPGNFWGLFIPIMTFPYLLEA